MKNLTICLALLASSLITFNLEAKPSQKCRDEIKNLCGGLPHEIGKDKFLTCMKEKSGNLSSECQRKGGGNKPSQKCMDEIKKLCGGMPHEIGRDKFMTCIKEKSSLLPEECKRKRKKNK